MNKKDIKKIFEPLSVTTVKDLQINDSREQLKFSEWSLIHRSSYASKIEPERSTRAADIPRLSKIKFLEVHFSHFPLL